MSSRVSSARAIHTIGYTVYGNTLTVRQKDNPLMLECRPISYYIYTDTISMKIRCEINLTVKAIFTCYI